MGAVPCLGFSCPKIVQGPQLSSEPDISWTERGLRVQERGNSPQDRILLSWEAEAENQLHRVLGLPSCSLLWKAGQPAQQPFPPVAQTLPSLGLEGRHVRTWGVEWASAFLRYGMHVDVTPGPSKPLQTLNRNPSYSPMLGPLQPQPRPSHDPPPSSIAATLISGFLLCGGGSNHVLHALFPQSPTHHPNPNPSPHTPTQPPLYPHLYPFPP